jgi:hypothetical protein
MTYIYLFKYFIIELKIEKSILIHPIIIKEFFPLYPKYYAFIFKDFNQFLCETAVPLKILTGASAGNLFQDIKKFELTDKKKNTSLIPKYQMLC